MSTSAWPRTFSSCSLFLPRNGGKETLRDISQLRPGRPFGEAPQEASRLLRGGLQVLGGENPSVEGELAPVGDRGAAEPTFDEPDGVCGRPDARLGHGRETEVLLFHQVHETGRVADGVPAVLGMRAVHCPAVEDDLEVQLPVAAGENLEARRFGDDDEGPRMLQSCLPGTGGAHLLVDDGVEDKVAVQLDAGAPDGHERGGHRREPGFHVTGAATVGARRPPSPRRGRKSSRRRRAPCRGARTRRASAQEPPPVA